MTHSRKNFKITIEYDGTPYAGWQIQPRQSTIQGEIEKVLSIILNQPVTLTGSGRTDAGVHAMGQTANFHAATSMTCPPLKRGMNSMLKGPIVIREIEEVPDHFHARYHAISKEYHYHILNRPEPCAVGRNYRWHIPLPLDVTAMNHCCSLIRGEHDFKSFEGAGSPRSHTVRHIYDAVVEPLENQNMERLVFKVKGNGFLRFMVRNIVGTLVQAGLSKLTPKEFHTILLARDRQRAAATAPARGLFLMRVDYPLVPAFFEPPDCSD
ncbi:tRNA pseudouridine38-40 synthase [Desulfocicer vacuolatum DSM 3385]|uniref:tRNA pseudouridine synthase A n=1 Tax=Desulfocicer vacuolatum DSM 3385 TaxID=1121400 RepID=A0A1W1ZM73_9BACT|nr:tRNA pseudouridine(38-40) synthase TruA [Desulfocicer vacuolatum]SMC49516.1 tRNA pseudouridine38-40 synthase [Desulfocicer vacuolatum DSM 3385]